MLTRLVRIQLLIFTIASVVGIAVMALQYLQLPTLLGVGRMTVSLELPDAGGLYRFANVTYRGVQIGKVTAVDVDRGQVTATLKLDRSPAVPADVQAEIRSASAVGEQYVDLQPRRSGPPYLGDGAVIAAADVLLPQQIGPMMEQVSRLVGTIPTDKLQRLLDESFTGLNGSGPDLSSLIDSTGRITADLAAAGDRPAQLLADSAPVLESQAAGADALRTWSSSLAGVTAQLVADDPQVRGLLSAGPPAAQEVSRLLEQLRPTLPVLLANLTTLGQVAVVYHDSLRQLLVLLPPTVSYYQGENGSNNPTGIPVGDFRISVDDPPACTVGFLPPSAWRSPADVTTMDTPDGLYCKLPQDSPIAVRGARNYPCMGVPGKSAPTVQECYSDTPFQPLALRQHALGPYAFDPNLVGQGVPPDSRVTDDGKIFGPPAGTPAPDPSAPEPSVGIAHYDPQTGRYAAPDGRVYDQQDLNPAGPPQDWRQLLPGGQP